MDYKLNQVCSYTGEIKVYIEYLNTPNSPGFFNNEINLIKFLIQNNFLNFLNV